jgi:hypothetical protein
VSAAHRARAVFWAYATAFGALWGCLEITLGSFLHALRLPFVGVLLAALATGLLVAQRSLLPRAGLSLATGLVAALCKSISPGGIILGPMLGIGLEALLVELAFLALRRPALAAPLGGALAALWAASQMILTQWVMYGGALLEVYLALLRLAGEWLGLPPAAGPWAVALLGFAVAGMGAAGGLAGLRLGRRAAARLGLDAAGHEPAVAPAPGGCG